MKNSLRGEFAGTSFDREIGIGSKNYQKFEDDEERACDHTSIDKEKRDWADPLSEADWSFPPNEEEPQTNKRQRDCLSAKKHAFSDRRL